MTEEMAELVVVGAGQAALTLAETLRRAGDRRRIVLLGEEAHPPYQRPPLSKAYLSGKMGNERLWLKPRAWYRDNDISLRTGCQALKIDRQARSVLCDDGRAVRYTNLALATGSRPRGFPVNLGGGLQGVHTIRSIDDIDRLAPELSAASKFVVIGGGYIGLEAASVARAFGLQVTLIEAGPRILARVAGDITADMVRKLHHAHGVNLLEGAYVEQLQAGNDGAVTDVVLSDGTRCPADIVVVGIGAVANDTLARDTGLNCFARDGGGIVVDTMCRTSDPFVYAIGDVAALPISGQTMRLESVQNACDQARALANILMGSEEVYAPTPWFWSDQYDTKLQIAGLNIGADKIVFRHGVKTGTGSVWYFLGTRLIAIDASSDPRSYMTGKRWLEQGFSPCAEYISDHEADLREYPS